MLLLTRSAVSANFEFGLLFHFVRNGTSVTLLVLVPGPNQPLRRSHLDAIRAGVGLGLGWVWVWGRDYHPTEQETPSAVSVNFGIIDMSIIGRKWYDCEHTYNVRQPAILEFTLGDLSWDDPAVIEGDSTASRSMRQVCMAGTSLVPGPILTLRIQIGQRTSSK